MIFHVLKQRWLRKEYIKLQNRSRDRKPHWPKSLVIVFDAIQFTDVKLFEKWCVELKIPVKNLTLLAFTKDTSKAKMEGVVLFDKKLIKWNGGVALNEVKKLLDDKYDLQINFFEKPSVTTEYVSLKLDSSLKVGYATHEEIIYDLALDVSPKKHDLFISEIKKYLKILNN